MVTGKYSVLAFTLGLLCLGLSFSPTTGLAETIGTPGYDLSATPPPPPKPVYATIITGYVVDEDGNGVPGATVTLWEKGRVWQFDGKGHYARNEANGSQNPQSSGIRDPGFFMFGEVATDNYTVRVEKDGFIGAKYFYVSSDTGSKSGEMSFRTSETSVMVTLKGYYLPVFNSTQLSYGGAISGAVYDRTHNRPVSNVSLWQNGQMLKMPKNPQSSAPNGIYLFEHLAPGEYVVRAEANSMNGMQNNSTSVTVANGTVSADVVISSIVSSMHPPPPVMPASDDTNVITSIPAQAAPPNSSADSIPAPFPGTGIILVAMSVAAILVYCFRKSP